MVESATLRFNRSHGGEALPRDFLSRSGDFHTPWVFSGDLDLGLLLAEARGDVLLFGDLRLGETLLLRRRWIGELLLRDEYLLFPSKFY